MDYKDYYKIMGVERDAKQDGIKRAYRKLARKYHPDVSKEKQAEAKFKELGEAYEVLKDPEKRAAYDQLGDNWQTGQDFHPPPNWDAGFEYSSGGHTDANNAAFSDFFETLFGQGFGSAQGGQRQGASQGGFQSGFQNDFQARGEDHHAKVLIELEDSYQGAMREISLRTPELDSNGRIINKDRTLSVKIPKGVKQGQKIRLAGQGSPGVGGGETGDLYLEIEFKPHGIYRVESKDVYLNLPVTPWEAALGASIKMPTPLGKLDLKIPPSSTGGRKLRLKGQGIPGVPPGDIYVTLQITLPAADSETAKILYREMEQELAFNPRTTLGV